VTLHHVDGAHHHAGRAEAALQAVMIAEGFLHRMQLVGAFGQALDRHAPPRRSAWTASMVQLFTDLPSHDDAGAALAGVAADMRAGQAEMLAQELDQ
jgi:hypothetical protein